MAAMENEAALATTTAQEGGLHISLAAEKLGSFFGLPITNTLVMGWFITLVIVVLVFFYRRKVALVPGRLQVVFESMIEFVYDYVSHTLESKDLARRFFPLIMSIFLFVLAANLIQFLPGVGSIGFYENGELVPMFRSLNTDLNMTLALAIIAVITVQISGVVALGVLKYGAKFITLKSPMAFALGVIDLISEITRIISFSFRLFGNILAGEIMLAIAAFFLPYVLPVPLMLFEVFVAFVQAGVFAMLTLFFIKIAIMEPH